MPHDPIAARRLGKSLPKPHPMASTVASPSVDRYVNPQVASAVIRLLAIALQVVQTSERSPDARAPLVPGNAWTWPSVTSELLTHGRRWPVKFSVNPKALMVSDSRTFPVGSALLVETGGPDVMLDHNIVRPLALVASRFIMIRSVRMVDGPHRRKRAAVWTHATYDGEGHLLHADVSLCGVCRLPVDTSQGEGPDGQVLACPVSDRVEGRP